jgi:hypothetical protein
VEEYHQDVIGVDTAIEVWCREDEVEDIALEEPELVEETGGEPDELDT